jgi:rhodanese-related sulfurtransferase
MARPQEYAATLLALAVLAGAGCGYDGPMLTVQELKAALDDPERAIVVIDVRPASQYAKGHVPGSRNRPLTEIERWSGGLSAVRDEVAVICNCGRSALAAAKQLKQQGTAVILVKGGYQEWIAAGYPREQGDEDPLAEPTP